MLRTSHRPLNSALPPLALALALVAPVPVLAQSPQAPQASTPVVQPLPVKSPGLRLNDALGRLAKNPQDVDALAEAGRASLALGDGQAAIGFYRRALAIQPDNARLKAGLASAYVLSEDPFTAIELFDEAEKAGPIEPALLADRGLAFDLVGDNLTAQSFYRQSLAGAPSDETTRRLALSLAISRDRSGMERTLGPLLEKQDKAAWRTRAFSLAILGQTDEAEEIARQTMPPEMATAITAYLRYMPKLTAAQQAGAANLGRFPRAAEIGNDDPRLAYYSRSRVQVAAAAAPPPAQAAAPTRTRRDGRIRRDDGRNNRPAAAPAAKQTQARPPAQAAVPPPEPQVARVTAPNGPKAGQGELPPIRPVTAAATSPAVKPPPPPVPAPAPAPAPVRSVPVQVAQAALPPAPSPGFDLARSGPVPAPAPPPRQSAPPPRPTSIEEAFADLAPPSREVEPQEGAVDVRQIAASGAAPRPAPARSPVVDDKSATDRAAADKAARDKATKDKTAKDKAAADKAAKDKAAKDKAAKDKAAKEKAKPSHPSRIWVQVATGRSKPALGFDWRRMVRENPAVFKGRSPNVAAWGQTNRLLAGPFPTARDANAFLAQLKKAGIDGAFVWTSPAGQVVEALAAGK
ncbi:MAG: SPOR domain-containing protein [Sphingomonadaceae bacterium]|nr:SPOR domain-containing protein [Sphingomonadaceae bacterium]